MGRLDPFNRDAPYEVIVEKAGQKHGVRIMPDPCEPALSLHETQLPDGSILTKFFNHWDGKTHP